jgi:hypothetical protein
MIEPILRTILATNANVSSLVADRIYWQVGPQNEQQPRLILQTISDVSAHTFASSEGSGGGGWERSRLQVDCYAPTYRQARELANTVRSVLDHCDGEYENQRYYFEHDSSRDMPPTIPEGMSEPTAYRISCDYMANISV